MTSYDTLQHFVEIRKRLRIVEERLSLLEPKLTPKPTIPSEKTRKPTPQERAKERAKLQQEAVELEEKQREERLLEREKLGLHGRPQPKQPTSPRRTLERRRADAAVGKFSIDDFSTSGDRAIAKQASVPPADMKPT